MQGEFENLLLDTQKEYSRSNRMKDKIIIVLIVLMFLEAVWETETKELFKELCNKLLQMGEHSDYEFLKEFVLDVEKEIKKIMRLYESLNGTGYDVNAIQSVQDKYHEKYKKKYNDRFTTKNNYRQIPAYPQYDGEEIRRTRRIGFEY